MNEMNEKIEVFTDGSTYGWNGKLGTVTKIGVGVFIPSLNIRFSRKEDGISNNVAEVRAMIRALELLRGRTDPIIIYSDSELAVRWLNKRKQSKKPHLHKELEILYALAAQCTVEARRIPRDFNVIANDLAGGWNPGDPIGY